MCLCHLQLVILRFFQDGHADQSKEMERPGAIVSNHVSYVDILYHMSASFPSFVAKVLQTVCDMASVYMISFFHYDMLILTCLSCTFCP